MSNLEYGVQFAELLLKHELRAIEDRRTTESSAFITTVVRVAVDDGSDIVEAVQSICQPLRPEILDDLHRLAFERLGHRGVVEHDEKLLCAKRPQRVLEFARLAGFAMLAQPIAFLSTRTS